MTANTLEDLVSKPKAKRLLKKVNFDWDNPEVTYTSESQGGAASLKNEAYLFKAKKAKLEDLDEEQLSILKEIDEEFVPLEKHLDGDNKTTPSSEGTGENNNDTGIENMSEEILKELAELKRDNAILKAQKNVSGFGLDAETEEGLASAIADLEKDAQAAVMKALTSLKASGEAEVEKAVEKAKAEAKPTEDTDLQKALDSEAGVGGEPEASVEKSFLDEIADFQDVESGANK